MVTGSCATRSLAAALSVTVAWKRCSPMVMLMVLMGSSCWLGEVPVRSPVRRRSDGEQDLRGGALVHRLVALRRLVEGQREVEDLARVDLAVPDELHQL